ncbi:MAG: hypothetical protein KatS3mg015_3059 [Fimbriimonadales bacterium]|nr:MAG: hypothetical protein KatS3mg015_3059 [Fimbriimonadales bacterium]
MCGNGPLEKWAANQAKDLPVTKGFLTTALAGALFWTHGCVPRQPPEPLRLPEPTPKILVEEEIIVPERPELAILDVREEPQEEPGAVVVSGTVVNRGRGRARNLTVTVQAIDADGNELLALPAKVDATVLDGNSSVGFRLRLQRPPGTVRYHVVAESR